MSDSVKQKNIVKFFYIILDSLKIWVGDFALTPLVTDFYA